MNEPIVNQIRDQPRLLRELCGREGEVESWVKGAGKSTPRRVWLVGCGDMFFAASAAALHLQLCHALDVRAMRSMDLRWCRQTLLPQDWVVAASVSGRTPRTLEALRLARRSGARVLAISDDPAAPLAREAGEVLILGSAPVQLLRQGIYPGYATQVPQTRTFLAALQVFLAAGAHAFDVRLCLNEIPERVERFLDPAEQAAMKIAAQWCNAPLARVTVLASGPTYPLAQYAAAKCLEYAVPAHAQCIEEFNHLEMFVEDERSAVLALAPDSQSLQRWEELRGSYRLLGSRCAEWSIGEGGVLPAVEPLCRPFVVAVAVQWTAVALARALGRDLTRWVGGVRTGEIHPLSQRNVRGSRICDSADDFGDDART